MRTIRLVRTAAVLLSLMPCGLLGGESSAAHPKADFVVAVTGDDGIPEPRHSRSPQSTRRP